MSNKKPIAPFYDTYRKNLKQNLFSSIASNLRSNITISLGNLDIILESNQSRNTSDSLHTIKNSLTNLENLAAQIDSLSTMAFPEFVEKNVDLIKILNIITENLKGLASQRNIDIVFLSDRASYITKCSPLMMDRIAGHLISMVLRVSNPSDIVNVIAQRDEAKNFTLQISFSPNFKYSEDPDSEGILESIFSKPSNLIDAVLLNTICLTYGIRLSISRVQERLVISLPLPPLSNNDVEDDFLEEFNLWNTFQLAEEFEIFEEPSDDNNPGESESQIILIIEDNHEVGRLLKKTFQREFKIIEAANGFEGMRKAISFIPDLILSDIHMPGVNGIDLTRIIKNNEKTSHIPVVLLTADTYEVNKIRAIESGADEILIKPVSLKELRVRVSTLLENREKLRKSMVSEVVSENITPPLYQDKFILKINNILNENFADEDFGVENLSDLIGMSPRQLQRKIRAVTGKSPNNLIRTYRLEKARGLIVNEKFSISEAAYSTGFNNLSYFAKCYKEEFGESPSDSTDFEG
ncbi:hypothetical protein MASR1M107_15920 [Ignavibacteriales bacterium]